MFFVELFTLNEIKFDYSNHRSVGMTINADTLEWLYLKQTTTYICRIISRFGKLNSKGFICPWQCLNLLN